MPPHGIVAVIASAALAFLCGCDYAIRVDDGIHVVWQGKVPETYTLVSSSSSETNGKYTVNLVFIKKDLK